MIKTKYVNLTDQQICLSKKQFALKEARERINVHKKTRFGKNKGTGYRVYQCPVCNFWHLSTIDKPERERGLDRRPLKFI